MDLLGVLWTVPLEGGVAQELTGDFSDATQPDWSPDGRRIAFQSYRDGYFHLWTIGADGTGLRQLTTGPYDHREPRFSPDGRRLAFSSDRSGGYGTHVLDLAPGTIATWADSEKEEGAPSWSPDGASIAFTVEDKAIDAVDQQGNRRTLATITEGRLDAPSWSPHGRDIVYTVTHDGRAQLMRSGRPVTDRDEEVFPFRAMWLSAGEILYTGDGKLRRRSLATGVVKDVDFTAPVSFTRRPYTRRVRDFDGEGPRPVRGIVGPALSPDGRRVAFCALNDLWLMTIGERPTRLTRDSFSTVDPAWSPDGRSLCYTSDRAGNPDLWVRDLETGEERRLTAPPHTAVAGAWSPDGSRIAFQNRTRNAAQALGVADQLGTVEPGKLAGLAFVEGDPLLDITALANVAQVMRNGVLHRVDDLLRFPVPDEVEPDVTPAAWDPEGPLLLSSCGASATYTSRMLHTLRRYGSRHDQ